MTLQRQINQHRENIESQDLDDQIQDNVVFNPLEWATHAAAISQYYVCENDFATARHCLCCSEAILDQLHKSDFINAEKLAEQTQSIRRCWGKYAISLLNESKMKLRQSIDSKDEKFLLKEMDKVSKFRFNMPSSLYNLDLCEKNAITANIALNYEQARSIFLKAQTILNQVKDFFKLDG